MTSPDNNQDFQTVLTEGEVLLDKGKLDKAEELLRQALAIEPENPRVLNKLGVCLIRQNRKAEAKASFERAIRSDDRYAPAYSNLGNVFREEGNLDRAVELYEKAIRTDPDFSAAYHNLGVVLKQQGKIGPAVDNLKKATKLQRNVSKDDLKKVPKTHRLVAYAILTGLAFSLLYFFLKVYR